MFDLNDDIIGDILFAMEDQGNSYTIDLKDGKVMMLDENGEYDPDVTGVELAEPYDDLPEWTSRDGFDLMEGFAETVSNPEIRKDLAAALKRGRGVFRAFKDAVERDRAVAERWFAFKDAAMTKVVVEWYEELRESKGLERLGLEPEETEDLVLSDYSFKRHQSEAWSELARFVAAARTEAAGSHLQAIVDFEFERLDAEFRDAFEVWIVTADNAVLETEAVAAARIVRSGPRAFCRVAFLYVEPERRRLGLGMEMLEELRRWCKEADVPYFLVDAPFLPEGFADRLGRSGFSGFGPRLLGPIA